MKTQPPPSESDAKESQPMTIAISCTVRPTQDGQKITSEEVRALRLRIEKRIATELCYQHIRAGGEEQYRLEAI